jgi:hypothetical protein
MFNFSGGKFCSSYRRNANAFSFGNWYANEEVIHGWGPPLTEYVDNVAPELSANQLSEFLDATHTRKEGILRQARYIARESSPPRIRYSDARRSIARFLTQKIRDFGILQQAKDRSQAVIDGATGGRSVTEFALSNAKLSIEAIDAFIAAFNSLGIATLNFTLGEDRPRDSLLRALA